MRMSSVAKRNRATLTVVASIAVGLAAAACGTGTSGAGTSGAAPTVNAFSTSNDVSGASVTVTGSGFTGVSSVTFNGMSAAFTVASPSEIRAEVPRGATN